MPCFFMFTPPYLKVRVFCSPIPLYYHTFDYLSILFSILIQKTPSRVFSQNLNLVITAGFEPAIARMKTWSPNH